MTIKTNLTQGTMNKETLTRAKELEKEQPKKKRPKILSMFYALLMCVVFAVMLTCADVLVCKLLGWHCDIYNIIRSIAIAYVFFILSSLVEKS